MADVPWEPQDGFTFEVHRHPKIEGDVLTLTHTASGLVRERVVSDTERGATLVDIEALLGEIMAQEILWELEP